MQKLLPDLNGIKENSSYLYFKELNNGYINWYLKQFYEDWVDEEYDPCEIASIDSWVKISYLNPDSDSEKTILTNEPIVFENSNLIIEDEHEIPLSSKNLKIEPLCGSDLLIQQILLKLEKLEESVPYFSEEKDVDCSEFSKGPFAIRLYYEYEPTDTIQNLISQDKIVYGKLIAQGRSVDFYPRTIAPSSTLPVLIYNWNYTKKIFELSSHGIKPNLKWVTNLKDKNGSPSYTRVCAYLYVN